MIRKLATAVALAALTLTSAACNTVQGLGRDIESVGSKGEEVITQATSGEEAQDAR